MPTQIKRLSDTNKQMLQFRESAIRTIRQATGRNWEVCRERVNALPQTLDGKSSLKVNDADVKAIIRDLNNTVEVSPVILTEKNRAALSR